MKRVADKMRHHNRTQVKTKQREDKRSEQKKVEAQRKFELWKEFREDCRVFVLLF